MCSFFNPNSFYKLIWSFTDNCSEQPVKMIRRKTGCACKIFQLNFTTNIVVNICNRFTDSKFILFNRFFRINQLSTRITICKKSHSKHILFTYGYLQKVGKQPYFIGEFSGLISDAMICLNICPLLSKLK